MTRVLLTGASGFIAAHILDILITRGYSVVATVRSIDKANKIKDSYPDTSLEQLDFAIVEDVARDGAFDRVIVADPPFQAVIHTASPFHFNVIDIQQDLLDPAVKGTTGILKSMAEHAPSVRQVVITSSFASIVNPFKGSWPEHTYSEKDWNPITPAQAHENIPNGYRASKTFAEKAAWAFLEQENPNFTLVTLCPPQVFGPVVHHLATLDSLNTSNQVIRDIIQGKLREKIPPNGTFTWVDVRDLALCHVLALERPESANQRLMATAGPFSNRELVEIIRENCGQFRNHLPSRDICGGDYPKGGFYKVDNARIVDVLGIEWRSLESSVIDTVRSLQMIKA